MRGRFSPKGLTEVEEMQQRGVGHAVDLRSDTVTRPSAEMRRAMMMAEVGDDVYGEDPTVNRLEARAAEIFQHEAALFVPTGTMANQIAIHLHTRPGQQVICEARTHLYHSELGMAAAFSGCALHPVRAATGRLLWSEVQPALQFDDPLHKSRTGLVVVENTHNHAGGVATPPAISEGLCRQLQALGVATHLDGARLFNASVALGVPVATLAKPFDSVMFCLSKGLGAPVGSILLGLRVWIDRARIVRKMLGGGMRQAGVLAAAGLIALEKGPARLEEDHANARHLAAGLATIQGLRLENEQVDTNIVVFSVRETEFNAAHVVARLAERNVLVSALDDYRLRLVTHLDVDRTDCDEALFALRAVIERE